MAEAAGRSEMMSCPIEPSTLVHPSGAAGVAGATAEAAQVAAVEAVEAAAAPAPVVVEAVAAATACGEVRCEPVSSSACLTAPPTATN